MSDSEKKIAEYINLVQSIKTNVIINGTPILRDNDLAKLRTINDTYRECFDYSKPVVVSISRFDFPKNMKLAYEIAKQRPNYLFMWIGDGPDLCKIKEISHRDNVNNIIFVGFDSLPIQHLAKAAVYLSTSRWEGLPLALLEAMSVGLPIVASDVAGNRDVVNSINGSLYTLGDISSALDKLDYWVERGSDQSIRNKIVAMHKEKFSIDEMCSQTVSLYQRL